MTNQSKIIFVVEEQDAFGEFQPVGHTWRHTRNEALELLIHDPRIKSGRKQRVMSYKRVMNNA